MTNDLQRQPRLVRSATVGALLVCSFVPFTFAQETVGEVFQTTFGDIGTAMAALGDVDGDGFDDFAVSTPSGLVNGQTAGVVQVISGRTLTTLWRFDERPRLDPAFRDTAFGASIANAGDYDGDGIDDLVVASSPVPNFGGGARALVEVFSCRDGSLLDVLLDRWNDPALEVAVSGGKDIDGDSIPDVVIGEARRFARGRVTVVSGRGLGVLLTIDDATDEGRFGAAVSIGDDIDGDGTLDLFVGEPEWPTWLNTDPDVQRGRLWAFSGATGAALWTVDGPLRNLFLGLVHAPIHDFDGDGIRDVALGVSHFPNATGTVGRLEIRSGSSGALLFDADQSGPGFSTFGNAFGSSVAAAGDVDGDGTSDIVVGAPLHCPPGLCASGLLKVLSGVDGSELFIVRGTTAGESVGITVLGGVDSDGDGFVEVLTRTENGLNVSPFSSVRLIRLTPENGETSCLGTPNSTLARGVMRATSPSNFLSTANDITFEISSLPPFVMGYPIVSTGDLVVLDPGSFVGRLCIASPRMGRFVNDIAMSDASGSLTVAPDMSLIPLGDAGGVTPIPPMPGQTLHFQFWHRDVNSSGASTSTFTGATRITWR